MEFKRQDRRNEKREYTDCAFTNPACLPVYLYCHVTGDYASRVKLVRQIYVELVTYALLILR
jgi:hypothetical protein